MASIALFVNFLLLMACAACVEGRKKLSAVVIGASGATGRQLAMHLAMSDRTWGDIYLMHRGNIDVAVPDGMAHWEENSPALTRLHSLEAKRFLEMDSLPEVDVLFNCIGSTRGAAGSAEAFVEVEVAYTEHALRLAEKAGVRHVSVVTAEGANAALPIPAFLTNGGDKSWLSTIPLLHPLLYVRTLGQKQEAVATSKISSRSIFQPGMLQRHMGDRFVENLVNRLNIGLSVRTLAYAMMKDAEAVFDAHGQCKVPSETHPTRFYTGNTAIEAYGRQ